MSGLCMDISERGLWWSANVQSVAEFVWMWWIDIGTVEVEYPDHLRSKHVNAIILDSPFFPEHGPSYWSNELLFLRSSRWSRTLHTIWCITTLLYGSSEQHYSSVLCGHFSIQYTWLLKRRRKDDISELDDELHLQGRWTDVESNRCDLSVFHWETNWVSINMVNRHWSNWKRNILIICSRNKAMLWFCICTVYQVRDGLHRKWIT